MKRVFVLNGPFAAEQSRGTIRQTGEQMTYWDLLKKGNKFDFFGSISVSAIVRRFHKAIYFDLFVG